MPFPKVTTDDYLQQAASDIISILKTKPSVTPSLVYGDDTTNALFKIAQLLGRSTLPPTALTIESQLPRVKVLPIVPPLPSVIRPQKITTNHSKVQQLPWPVPQNRTP
jgi:hypothetical protein